VNKIFLHIDINSYFATLLQQETPILRHKPVVIVKELGRSCVIAASKEAKKLGLGVGTNAMHAQKQFKDLVVMPCHFSLFLSATKKLKEIFYQFSPDVEIFSLDEGFIDYTPLVKFYPSPLLLAAKIQQKIKKDLGSWVTSNVGIGPNRFLAKMIGEVSPKGSIREVTNNNKNILLAQVGFKDVCGIGLRLEKKLRALGVTVPLQINFLTDQDLEKYFGPFYGHQLRKMGQGLEPLFLTRLEKNPHMKSVGRSITGFDLCDSEDDIKRVLYNLTEEVINKVRKMGLAGRQVGLFLSGNGKHFYKAITLKYYIRHIKDMFNLVFHKLYKLCVRDFNLPAGKAGVIKFGVSLSLLKPWDQTDQVLFDDYWRQEDLNVALDKINQKYGLFSVTSGLLLNKNKIIRPEVAGFFGDQKFQFLD
jgi:DNA polymerase IV